MARYKPKQFARAGLVRPVVETLCTMCGEPDPPEHDPDGDELPPAKLASQVPAALFPPLPCLSAAALGALDKQACRLSEDSLTLPQPYFSAATVGAQALDELACALPSKHVLPGALDFAARAAAAPEPHARLAACTVIVAVAEGCAEGLRRHMADALQVRAWARAAGAARGAAAPQQPGRSQGASALATRLFASPLLMCAWFTEPPTNTLTALFHWSPVTSPGGTPLPAPPRRRAPPAEQRPACVRGRWWARACATARRACAGRPRSRWRSCSCTASRRPVARRARRCRRWSRS